MRFYVEKADFEPFSARPNRKVLLLDTEHMTSNVKLEQMLSVERKDIPQSMVTLETEPSTWESMKEGSWYNLPASLLKEFEYIPANPEAAGGLFLRGHLTTPYKDIDFTPYLSHQRNAILPFTSLLMGSWNHQLEIAVLDCGQGNWNEVRSSNSVLIYDLGASQRYTPQDVRNFLNRRNLQSEQRHITALVSHWDVDHYQAILGMKLAEIAKLSQLIAPSQVPNTSTFKRVKSALTTVGVPIQLEPPSVRISGYGRQIMLNRIRTVGPLIIYRATPGRSRNQTGLVVQVNGNTKTAVLTGDHHYQKVLNAISGAHTGNPLVLVAPHHGGAAGDLSISNWSAVFPNFEAIISTGPNSYKHPLPTVVADLSTLQGAPPYQTNIVGDIVIPL
jgi:beta-lactamase superfamily II metal-dependent hydrolase